MDQRFVLLMDVANRDPQVIAHQSHDHGLGFESAGGSKRDMSLGVVSQVFQKLSHSLQ